MLGSIFFSLAHRFWYFSAFNRHKSIFVPYDQSGMSQWVFVEREHAFLKFELSQSPPSIKKEEKKHARAIRLPLRRTKISLMKCS